MSKVNNSCMDGMKPIQVVIILGTAHFTTAHRGLSFVPHPEKLFKDFVDRQLKYKL